jgi:hypothetical protein
MTVVKVHATWGMTEPIIYCQWAENHVRRSNIFPESALKPHVVLTTNPISQFNGFAMARW